MIGREDEKLQKIKAKAEKSSLHWSLRCYDWFVRGKHSCIATIVSR